MLIRILVLLSLAGTCSLGAQQKIAPDHKAISVRGCGYIAKQDDGSLRFNRFDQILFLTIRQFGDHNLDPFYRRLFV